MRRLASSSAFLFSSSLLCLSISSKLSLSLPGRNSLTEFSDSSSPPSLIFREEGEEKIDRTYPNIKIFFLGNEYSINSFLIFYRVFFFSWGKKCIKNLVPIRNILVLVLARGGRKETYFSILYVASISFKDLLSVQFK